MSERFKQFQAVFPEEACLNALMRARHGGSGMTCPACSRPSTFEPRPKLRAFSCGHCNYMIQPGAGTPLDNRRTPLQLWFFALKLISEQGAKAATSLIEREARVPGITARRLVDDLVALESQRLDWFETLRRLVAGEKAAPAMPAVARVPERAPSKPSKAEEPGAKPSPSTFGQAPAGARQAPGG